MSNRAPSLVIEVYADIACPWCWIGEHRLRAALRQRPEVSAQQVWRPFQLQPEMPEEGLPWREFAESKFGGLDRASEMFAHVAKAGQQAGVEFRFDRLVTAPNTADAHALILLAGDQGMEVAENLFAAYFRDGQNLNDRQALRRIATDAGMDAEVVEASLGGPGLREAVRMSQRQAEALGIAGVPFFVFDGRYGLSGAQPTEVFLQAIDAATAAEV